MVTIGDFGQQIPPRTNFRPIPEVKNACLVASVQQVHSLREELSGSRSREASLSLSLSRSQDESLSRSRNETPLPSKSNLVGGAEPSGGADPKVSRPDGEGVAPSRGAGLSNFEGEAEVHTASHSLSLSFARDDASSSSGAAGLDGEVQGHLAHCSSNLEGGAVSPSRSDGVEDAVRARPDASQEGGGLGEATERLALAVRTLSLSNKK